MGPPRSVVDYSKWDGLLLEEDEEEDETVGLPETATALLEKGNRLLNAALEREEQDGSHLIDPTSLRAAFAEAAAAYEAAELKHAPRRDRLTVRILLNAATARYKLGEWRSGADKARRALEVCASQNGDDDDMVSRAREIHAACLREERNEFEATMAPGEELLTNGRFSEAADIFHKVSKLYSGSKEAHQRAVALTKLGEAREGLSDVLKAVQAYLKAAQLLFSLRASRLERRRLLRRAIALLTDDDDDLKGRTKETTAALLDAKKAYADDLLDDPASSEEDTEKDTGKDTEKDTPARAARAALAFARGVRHASLAEQKLRQDAVVSTLRKCVQTRFRGTVEAALCGDALAEALSRMGRFEEACVSALDALQIYECASSITDDVIAEQAAGCALSAARAAARCRPKSDAAELFVKAAERFSKLPGRRDVAGDTYLRAALLLKDSTEPENKAKDLAARAAREIARALDEEDASDSGESRKKKTLLHATLGRALLTAGRPAEAVKPARDALLLHHGGFPDDQAKFDTLELLADALAMSDQFDEAVNVIEDALRLASTTSLAWPSREQDKLRLATARAAATERCGPARFEHAMGLWRDVAKAYTRAGDGGAAKAAAERADALLAASDKTSAAAAASSSNRTGK